MAKLVWNILDLLKKYGEEQVTDFVSDFSCEKMVDGEIRNLNPDIEHFIKANAVQFARQKKSVTYIVGDSEDGAILGYFTIAHKSVEISADNLSKTALKKMSRYAEHNEQTNSYPVSGFLIAQFGKNYAVDEGKRISGKELMALTQTELLEMQHRAGGGIEYLDCIDDKQLMAFYTAEGFQEFGMRCSKDGITYHQFMKFF